jgi:hypothetical protein
MRSAKRSIRREIIDLGSTVEKFNFDSAEIQPDTLGMPKPYFVPLSTREESLAYRAAWLLWREALGGWVQRRDENGQKLKAEFREPNTRLLMLLLETVDGKSVPTSSSSAVEEDVPITDAVRKLHDEIHGTQP